MAENSKIEWTTHTFNPWRGCTKISPGCTNCYAETLSHRNPSVLGIWGDKGTRVVASESAWKEPLKWDRKAKEASERHRVFCASLADVFEDRLDLDEPRRRLQLLINDTPNLDWLLLTKRPESIDELWYGKRADWFLGGGDYLPNVWLGVSVEDQQRANERIPVLLQTPAAIRFLSVEPLLGPVNLCHHGFWKCQACGGIGQPENEIGMGRCGGCGHELEERDEIGVDWVIVGGESGHGARHCGKEWVRAVVGQCKAAGVPVFVKQMGSNSTYLGLIDRKGGNPEEWDEDLRVRQFPVRATVGGGS